MKRPRHFHPFGKPRTPFNPGTGSFLPVGEVRSFLDFTVVEVGNDMLLCEDADQRQALVAKPWAFRKSEYDGVTFDDAGLTFTWVDLDQRSVAAESGATYVEKVMPAYYVGEKIVAMRKAKDERCEASAAASELTDVAAGDYVLEFEDLNTAGRRWESSGVRAKVTAIGDNTLTVKLLEAVTEAGAGLSYATGATEFTVWKPWELQRQAYDGLTIDGVTYSYTDAQGRHSSGDEEEDEIIIPRYYVGAVVVVAQLPGGYCPGGPVERMFDTNEGRRAWAKAFVP